MVSLLDISARFGIDGVPELDGGEQLVREPRSISDPQQALPLAKIALEAYALRDLECRDHASLDLLAGFACCFAGPPVFPPGLIEMRSKPIASNGGRLK